MEALSRTYLGRRRVEISLLHLSQIQKILIICDDACAATLSVLMGLFGYDSCRVYDIYTDNIRSLVN